MGTTNGDTLDKTIISIRSTKNVLTYNQVLMISPLNNINYIFVMGPTLMSMYISKIFEQVI